MKIVEHKYFKLWFWGFIILGILSPLIVRVIIEGTATSFLKAIRRLPYLLLAPGHNLLLLALWNDIPFIAFSMIVKLQMGKVDIQNSQIYYQCLGKVIGGGVGIFIVSLFIHIVVWMDLFYGPSRSTAVIAFAFIPVYGAIVAGTLYWVGGLVGKLILWNRSRKSKGDKLSDEL